MTHLRAADYTLAHVDQRTARELVERWHYARGGPNTGVFRHGLFHVGCSYPLGVAWWLPPTKAAAQSVHSDWRRVLSLSRLVVAPGLPTNAASFLLGRSIRLVKQDGRWVALVTYADERMGHTGAIYRATNWHYAGARKGDPVYVDQCGRQVSRKAGRVSRTAAEMAELGYTNIGRSIKHKFVLTW